METFQQEAGSDLQRPLSEVLLLTLPQCLINTSFAGSDVFPSLLSMSLQTYVVPK